MEVYIEYVVLDNFIINSILLSLTAKLLSIDVLKKNIVFSSLLGTIFVIFMPIITNVEVLMLVYRVVVASIMIAVICKHKSFGKYLSALFTFVVITFLFGGILIANFSVFNIVYTSSGLIFLNFEIPLSIFILPIYAYSLVTQKVVIYLKNRIKISKFIYNVCLINNNVTYNLRAFLDTGNSLFDVDGRPVVVVELKTFILLFPNYPIHKLIANKLSEDMLSNAHYIKVATVNANEKLLAFDIDKLIINDDNKVKEFKKVCVALSMKNFDDYNVILHKNLC